ncbi:MAG TPA: HlyD family efflux transporter periplasmic adaptor subunit [Allosphingosinicella sp.]
MGDSRAYPPPPGSTAGGRGERPLEELRIAPPISVRVVSIVSAACVGVLLTAAAVVDVSQTRTVAGAVTTGGATIAVVPSRAGMMKKLFVREGSVVSAGAPLVELDIPTSRENGLYGNEMVEAAYHAEEASMSEQIARQRGQIALAAEKASSSRQALLVQRRELGLRIIAQEGLAKKAREREATFEPFLARGFVSRHEYDLRHQESVSQMQEVARLRGELAALDGNLGEVAAQERETRNRAELTVGETQSRLRALAQDHLKDTTSQTLAMRSPAKGVVTAIQYRPGEFVDGRHPVLFVFPKDEPLEAQLVVPNENAATLRVGQVLKVEAVAFPASEFGYLRGEIVWISGSAIQPQDVATPYEGKTPVFLVRLRLSRGSLERSAVIRSGMRLRASIIVKRTSFLRFLLPESEGS